MDEAKLWDLVVVGAGPAGLSAGIYGRLAGLETVIVDKGVPGGQLLDADIVDDYPGFPDPLKGAELADRMRRQAEGLGASVKMAEAKSLVREETGWRLDISGGTLRARTVILALGTEPRRLPAAGADRLTGRGVSYCAACDGYFFRDRDVLVVGAGDSALKQALFLAGLCAKVYVAVRHPGSGPEALKALWATSQRALSHPKIEFIWNAGVEEIKGEKRVESVLIRDLETGSPRELAVAGVFVAIGTVPATGWLEGTVELSEGGYIRTDSRFRTSAPGVFAVGEARERDWGYSQAVVAAAEGAIAALGAKEYISGGRWP